jgi:hypothetical protein
MGPARLDWAFGLAEALILETVFTAACALVKRVL